MARRPSLTDAGVTRPSRVLTPPQPPVSEADARRAPARQGKKAVAFWVTPEASMQLRATALTMNRSVQDVMTEALDDWFRKHGLHRLAGKEAA